jgi:hypothetical protein
MKSQAPAHGNRWGLIFRVVGAHDCRAARTTRDLTATNIYALRYVRSSVVAAGPFDLHETMP